MPARMHAPEPRRLPRPSCAACRAAHHLSGRLLCSIHGVSSPGGSTCCTQIVQCRVEFAYSPPRNLVATNQAASANRLRSAAHSSAAAQNNTTDALAGAAALLGRAADLQERCDRGQQGQQEAVARDEELQGGMVQGGGQDTCGACWLSGEALPLPWCLNKPTFSAQVQGSSHKGRAAAPRW